MRLQADQRGVDDLHIDAEAFAKFNARRRAARLEPSAQDLGNDGIVRFRHLAVRCRIDRGIEDRIAVGRSREFQPLGTRPEYAGACTQRRRATLRNQFAVPGGPFRNRGQHHQRRQSIVQFVGVAHDRPRLGRHFGDRVGAQNSGAIDVAADGPAQLHRARAPFFERRVVEKRVRVRIQNLVTERRRLGRIDRDRTDFAGFETLQNADQAVEIHRFVQAVIDRLAHQHVIGNTNRPGEILGARGLIRKERRDEIVGAHPQQLRRHFTAAAHPHDRERAYGVPTPARREHRRGQHRLGQDVFDTCRLDVLEDDLERKGVLVGKREHDAVVGRRRLQFQIKRSAKALAQRQAPRAVDARAERCVQDQLHATGFVEESLGHDRRVGGDNAENRLAGAHVDDGLIRARQVEPALGNQKLARCRVVALVDGAPHRRHFARQFDRAAEAFAIPKRDRRRRTLRVFNAHHAGFDAADAPRRRAEHEDVARQAFDREVFI